jgi:hypothetical protein
MCVVSPSAAQAYKLGGKKWPTRTITYNAGDAPTYKEAIRRAVRAWNTSGVRVRFRSTSRRRARVHIAEEGKPTLGGGGRATLGWAPRSAVTERFLGGAPLELQGIQLPCGYRVPGQGRILCTRGPVVRLYPAKNPRDPFVLNDMAITAAHELGHILGLAHVRKRCTLMGKPSMADCPQPPEPWQLRCRLLEADDVRGAIRRYGGSMRPLAPEFCEASPAPGAPSELVATYDPVEHSVRVSWRNPTTRGVVFARVALEPGACPPSFDDALGVDVKRGERSSASIGAGVDSGPHCVAVRAGDWYGRTGEPVTTMIEVPPRIDSRPPRGEP